MMLSAGLRAWWSNPDDDLAQALLATVEGIGGDRDDPTYLAALGFAAPLDRGRLVGERLATICQEWLDGARQRLDAAIEADERAE